MGAALFCGSCSEEDMGVSIAEVKKAQYDREFAKNFGSIPQDQTWDFYTDAVTRGNLQGGERFFCEDLEKIGDFDFNDIVFDLVKNGSNAQVIIQAVGGTLPIYLYLGQNSTTPVGGGELHEAMGETKDANGRYLPINVGATNGLTIDAKSFPAPSSIVGKVNSKDIWAIVTWSDGTEYRIVYNETANGYAPQIFSVPNNTKWMQEDKTINIGYPDFFTGDWYNNCSGVDVYLYTPIR